MSFSINVTYGRNGGVYVHRRRICLWRVAITWWPYDADDVYQAGLDALDGTEAWAAQCGRMWREDLLDVALDHVDDAGCGQLDRVLVVRPRGEKS